MCVCVNYTYSHTYLLTMQGSLNLKVFGNLNDNVNFEEEKMNIHAQISKILSPFITHEPSQLM